MARLPVAGDGPRISVIIPSRLDPNPSGGGLYLDRALASVQRQTIPVHEVCIGAQRGARLPQRLPTAPRGAEILFCETTAPGQAAAVNAAAASATGSVLAFLEDDDLWEPKRLAIGLTAMRISQAPFASSNQIEVRPDGTVLRINDFATPSGWLIAREVWQQIGGMDTLFRWHVDTEFLGRLNQAGVRRIHLVEGRRTPQIRPWLVSVARHPDLYFTNEPHPLVVRAVNPHGGMARIASDPRAAQESRNEHEELMRRYGEIPW